MHEPESTALNCESLSVTAHRQRAHCTDLGGDRRDLPSFISHHYCWVSLFPNFPFYPFCFSCILCGTRSHFQFST